MSAKDVRAEAAPAASMDAWQDRDWIDWQHTRNPAGPGVSLAVYRGDEVVGAWFAPGAQFRAGGRESVGIRVDGPLHAADGEDVGQLRRALMPTLLEIALEEGHFAWAVHADTVDVLSDLGHPGVSHGVWLTRGPQATGAEETTLKADESVAAALECADVQALLRLHAEHPDGRLHRVPRIEDVRWRYADAPRGGYVAASARAAGATGLAIGHRVEQGGTVTLIVDEVFCAHGPRGVLAGRAAVRALMGQWEATSVRALDCAPSWAGVALRAAGLKPSGAGVVVAARAGNNSQFLATPGEAGGWRLTAGSVT